MKNNKLTTLLAWSMTDDLPVPAICAGPWVVFIDGGSVAEG
jgi:hypothetical protein